MRIRFYAANEEDKVGEGDDAKDDIGVNRMQLIAFNI